MYHTHIIIYILYQSSIYLIMLQCGRKRLILMICCSSNKKIACLFQSIQEKQFLEIKQSLK